MELSGTPVPLADAKWYAVFRDDTLNGSARTALERNFDVSIAAERVQQARAEVGITRADQFPFVDAQAQFSAARQSSLAALRFVPVGTNLSATFTQVGAALSWEADFVGATASSDRSCACTLSGE